MAQGMEQMNFRWSGVPQQQPSYTQAMGNAMNTAQQNAMLETERRKLEQELSQNEAKIAELKQRLANAREDIDNRDRRLAENRASVGDIGNSMAHQGRIEDRAYRWKATEQAMNERAKQKAENDEYNKQKIIAAIEDLDIYAPKDAESKNAVELKRSRLVKELKDKYGIVYETKASVSVDETPNFTPDEWQKFYLENTDENGNFKSDIAKKIYDKYSPRNAEEAARKKENISHDTVDEAEAKKKAAAFAEKKAVNDAIDDVMSQYSGWNMKTGETKTITAKNGRTVTITRTEDGKTRYTIGNTFKER